jgi:hypothetical protein
VSSRTRDLHPYDTSTASDRVEDDFTDGRRLSTKLFSGAFIHRRANDRPVCHLVDADSTPSPALSHVSMSECKSQEGGRFEGEGVTGFMTRRLNPGCCLP